LLSDQIAFDLEKMKSFSTWRRPPQEVYFIPREDLKELIYSYQSETTGFSWREYPADQQATSASLEARKGEGIGWLPERVRLPGTSSYLQKWNIRNGKVSRQLNRPIEF